MTTKSVKAETPVSCAIDRLEKAISKSLGNDQETRKEAVGWLLQAIFVLSMPYVYPDLAETRTDIGIALTRIACLEEHSNVGDQP